MSSRTEERLREAMAAVRQSVRPGDIPALRLPAPARRAGRSWLIPAGAAASVLVLAAAIAVAVARQTTPHQPRSCGPATAQASPAGRISLTAAGRSLGPGPADYPRFLVTVSAGEAEVRATSTGRLIATVRAGQLPATFEGVAAAPGGRTFYLAAALGLTGGRQESVSFFRLTLGRSGRPRALQRLTSPTYLEPVPFRSNGLATIPMAVSPDGTELAFATVGREIGVPGQPLRSGSERIIVQDLASGTRRTWAAWPAAHAEVSSLSWAADGQLGVLAALAGATVRGRKVIRRDGSEASVFMVLDTGSCGSGLVRDSRLVSHGTSAGILSPDGRIVYARIISASGSAELAAISVATGAVSRVLLSGPQAADADVLIGGPQSAQPAPVSIDGSSLLFPLAIRHVPVRTSGPPYVIAHLAAVNVATGRISQLPFPIRWNPQVPAPALSVAW